MGPDGRKALQLAVIRWELNHDLTTMNVNKLYFLILKKATVSIRPADFYIKKMKK